MHVLLKVGFDLFLSGSLVRRDNSAFHHSLVGLDCATIVDEGLIEILGKVVHYDLVIIFQTKYRDKV